MVYNDYSPRVYLKTLPHCLFIGAGYRNFRCHPFAYPILTTHLTCPPKYIPADIV